MTTVISIGNTDNKLTQQEWSFYVYSVENLVRRYTKEIYFVGGSDSFAPYQNATFVFDMADKPKKLFRRALRRVLRKFSQDSAAWIEAPTDFLLPAPPEEGQSEPMGKEG